jgi:hypothetical protein
VRRDWELDDLIDAWTLVEADRALIANKHGPSKLGFCLLLKFFEIEGRFPRHPGEVPPAAVDYLARQVKVDPADFAAYAFTGRTIEYHRRQIRAALGFREATHGDRDKLAVWLAGQVCPSELDGDRQRQALLAKCRAERIEPPGRGSIDKIIGAANRAADEQFCVTIVGRLSESAIAELDKLVAERKKEEAADDADGDGDGSRPACSPSSKPTLGRWGWSRC